MKISLLRNRTPDRLHARDQPFVEDTLRRDARRPGLCPRASRPRPSRPSTARPAAPGTCSAPPRPNIFQYLTTTARLVKGHCRTRLARLACRVLFWYDGGKRRRVGMRPFKVGIDERILGPLGLSPFETLDWAIMNEADGVQFSAGAGPSPDRSFLRELAQYAEENRLYLEWGGGEYDPLDPVDRTARDSRRDQPGGRRAGPGPGRGHGPGRRFRPEALGERARSRPRSGFASPPEASASWGRCSGTSASRSPWKRGSVFTTFDLLRLFEMCDVRPGEHLGVCLDTMNVLTDARGPGGGRRARPPVGRDDPYQGRRHPPGRGRFHRVRGRGRNRASSTWRRSSAQARDARPRDQSLPRRPCRRRSRPRLRARFPGGVPRPRRRPSSWRSSSFR